MSARVQQENSDLSDLYFHLGFGWRTRRLYGKEMTAETELKIAIEDPSQPEIIMLLR